MALNPKEELELLQLEEEDYQHSLKAAQSDPMRNHVEQAAQSALDHEDSKFDPQAAMSGLAQGTTFGFSDELGAGADVAGDVLSGKGPNSLYDKYREYQKLREASNKADAERSPYSYLTGEVGGAVASGLAMPSLGAGRVAAMGGKLSPTLGKYLAGELGGGVTRILGKGANAAIDAAPMGALYGVGASEHNIEHPAELVKDAGQGMLLSSGAGAVMAAAGAGAGVVSDRLKKMFGSEGGSNILRQTGKAFDYGKQGINLGDDATLASLAGKSVDESEALTNRIFQADEMLGQKVGQAIDTAQQSGVRINVDPAIQESSFKIANIFMSNPALAETVDPKSLKLIRTIATREMGDLTPTEAKALRDYLYDLSENLAGFNSDAAAVAKGFGNNLAGSLDNALKSQIPEYAEAATRFKDFRAKVPETLISKASPEKYNKAYLGNLKNKELSVQEAAEDVLSKAALPGDAVNRQRRTLYKLGENLEGLEKTNPEAIQAMGGSAKDIIGGLKSKADELAMLRHAQGYEPNEGSQGLVKRTIAGIGGTGRGLTMTVANKAGLAAQSAPVKMGTKLFSIPNEGLLMLAQKLKNVNPHLGTALENSLNSKSEVAKNAVLFKLMQDPSYRQLLRDEGLGEENER